MRKRRPEGLKFSHPPQPFSIPIFAVWGAFFPPRFVELRHLAQRRRDAKAGTGLARPDLKKLQLGCQQRLTNAAAERWATSPFISLIHFKDENCMRFQPSEINPHCCKFLQRAVRVAVVPLHCLWPFPEPCEKFHVFPMIQRIDLINAFFFFLFPFSLFFLLLFFFKKKRARRWRLRV